MHDRIEQGDTVGNDETDGTDARGVDAATAARLLHGGEQIGAKVYQSIDFRTQALVQAGTAVATAVYLGTFLYLFSNELATAATGGAVNSTSALLIPILALSQLSIGVRERLKAALPTHHPKLATTVGLLSLLPALVVAVGIIVGQLYPWWVLFAVAVIPAIQPATLAIFSVRRMRAHDIRPLAPAPRVPLSSAAQLVTAGLGLLCGVSAASGAFAWKHVAMLALMIILLTMLGFYRSRWGLPAVGSEWGSPQWLGFGASFLLLMALTVVLGTAVHPLPWVGIVGGLIVALPLVVAAFQGSTIHERPEEFWDASAPQS